jgi:predicted MFS family arabinose efflux permease
LRNEVLRPARLAGTGCIFYACLMSLSPTDTTPGMKTTTVWIMTLAAGIVVANNYYNQPLLVDFAKAFHVSSAEISIVPILTQIGYACGIIFLLPLGDMVERRRLISCFLACSLLSLIAVALSPNLAWLACASFILGFTSVVPQVLPAFASQLAKPRDRGRVVGHIMGGLLCGILLSRFVAGFVGRYLGWAAIYWMGAGAMLLLAIALYLSLPYAVPKFKGHYFALLRSLVTLLKEQPVLRETTAVSSLQFAAFSAFWTTLAFNLYSFPEHYGSDVAGAFGLAGVVGVLAAPQAGRFADKRSPRFTVLVASVIFLFGYVLFAVAGRSIIGLAIGVILLDFAMQSAHVSNMARNYALIHDAASRLNTVYIGIRFIGGALGSACGNIAWSFWGWPGVCGTGLAFSSLAILAQFVMKRGD